ncbi:MAG TPA: hypothetical protein VMH04_08110 [Candidatus Solibacter sp.]|nr:hypothetical protein [Candidatus Solibacter sp.]
MDAMRQILVIGLAGAIALLTGCGGSSTGSSKTPPPVSIALNPPPSSTTVSVGSTAGVQFTPVVSNDSGNNGVDWAITCSNPEPLQAPCGTLSIPTMHSASGTAVTYAPPSTFTGGSLTVNVTVFATADHTQNVITPVTVTSYSTVLTGTYVFQTQGTDGSSGYPYQDAGVLTFAGNGNITGGEEIVNVYPQSVTYTLQGAAAPSSYFIGPDGRGTMTLNLQQSNDNSNLIQQLFTFSVVSSSKALIAELDVTTLGDTQATSLGNSGAGTLELQDSTAASTPLTGAFAFVTSGTDDGVLNFGSTLATTFGGVFNIDNNPSTGSISGSGSLADQDYYNTRVTEHRLYSCAPGGVTGNVTPPDSFGAVTITLTGATCFGVVQPASIQFTGFIVDATHVRLIETDDQSGSSGYMTSGIAVSQGVAAGTFTNASLSGQYVFGIAGFDDNLNITGAVLPSSLTSAGVLNTDGAGNVSGITDTFFVSLGFEGLPGFFADALSGTYSVDANQIGRADLALTFTGIPHPRPTILFYLTGDGTPPLVLYVGGEDARYPAVGTGIAYPQAANPSTLTFGNPETYAVSVTQQNGAENDGTGQMTATASGISGALTGTLDTFNNNNFAGTGTFPLVDTFTPQADSFGRISGTFTAVPGSGTGGPYVEYYMIDDNQGFFVETDELTLSQVSFGYFAQSCDVTSTTSCESAARKASEKPPLKEKR